MTSNAILPVRSAFSPALSVKVSTTSVESFVSDWISVALPPELMTPTDTLSGPRCLNAIPNPAASSIGKMKVQNTASGSRMNSRKRTSVSWTSELRLNPRSCLDSVLVAALFIAQMPARKHDEDVFEGRGRFARLRWREIRDVDRLHQLARRAEGDDVTVIDDCNTIAKALRFFHVVRGQHDRAAF